MAEPVETAVIVPVAAVEPLVASSRARLDRAAAWGVPAHVTVLYPFVAPGEVDDALLARLRHAVGSVPAFACTFARTRWFGDEVVWLAPEPAEPFAALTHAVWRAFPEHPPYAGAYDEVTPHLTVGQVECGTVEELRAAEAAVVPGLPVHTRITEALLVQGELGRLRWTAVATLPLG